MAPLRVAIVHYHLRTGGVTRVIDHALSSLAGRDVACVVLTGERPAHPAYWPQAKVLPHLAYDAEFGNDSVSQVIDHMVEAARETLGGAPDIWHIHNHSLGKNVVLPAVTMELAKRGERLALQIHDFAEDGRPRNYHYLAQGFDCDDADELGRKIYPHNARVIYVPLNARDAGFLRASGLAAEQVRMLHNPASVGAPTASSPLGQHDGQRLFLYPTRAIRRKNIGELLFWSALAGEEDLFGLTLAPENPTERSIYDPWVTFAGDMGLPVEFEMGSQQGVRFEDLIARAHAIVSTSIAEGFGLAFLEPWTMGKPLLGRNLSDITDEFVEAGVDLASLYKELRVPSQWVDEQGLKTRLRNALTAYYDAYRQKQPDDAPDRAWATMSNRDGVEFSRLDEVEQRKVIERAWQDKEGCGLVRPSTLEPARLEEGLIQRNRETVLREFSLQKYGERLVDIYTSLMNAPVGPLGEFSASRLLSQFLAPERFCLLRA